MKVFKNIPGDLTSLTDNGIREMVVDRNGVLWLFEDDKGLIWISSDDGLLIFDPETERFSHYTHNPANPDSIANNIVLGIYQDRSGLMWLATFGGADRFNPATLNFGHIQHDPDNPNGIGPGEIMAVLVEAKADVWLGIRGFGLSRIKAETGQATHYRPDPEDPTSLIGEQIEMLLEDSAGILWVPTWSGLQQFDPESETFRTINADYRFISAYEDSRGVLWFGTLDDGLLRYERDSETLTHYSLNPDDPHGLQDAAVSQILETSDNTFWIGTWFGGLHRFDRESEQFFPYQHDPEDLTSISHNKVNKILEGSNGALWVSTEDGLSRYIPESDTFARFQLQEGLPDTTILSMLEDNEGYLWIATKRGLSKFDPRSETFRNYVKENGLQGTGFSKGHARGQDSKLYFGGDGGLNAFYPQDIVDNPYIPPVLLTDFQLFNESVPVGEDSLLQNPLWDTETIILNHEQDFFSIEFAALSYAAPEKNRYRFKLEGFDKTWHEVGAERRFATYTSLPPGDYTFRVQAANEDGVWNEQGASIKITVTPPWWETTLFRGSMVVL